MGSRLIFGLEKVRDLLDSGHYDAKNMEGNLDVSSCDITPSPEKCKPLTHKGNRKVNVVGCLKEQHILKNLSSNTISAILKSGKVLKFNSGETLTCEGESGECAYFILQGAVDVFIKTQKVATRFAKECVGEMSILEPTERRCATLIAQGEVDVLRLDFELFESIILNDVTALRNITTVLCARLRERSKSIEKSNDSPRLFIGSSTEGKDVADRLRTQIERVARQKGCETNVKVWDKDVFEPSESSLESLIKEAKRSDFAILILTADDMTRSRKRQKKVPRDNVIFELGLFMGSNGRERTYMLVDANSKLPSDLNGITYLPYSETSPGHYRFGDIVKQVIERINDLGVKQ